MLFAIEEDTEWRVTGWVVPDHPTADPILRIQIDGRWHRLAANGLRDALRAKGLHLTGRCGFVLDERTCPGLRAECEVEVYEERSNILVYRRIRSRGIPVRLFHLETQTRPVLSLERDLAARFEMSYSGLETIPEEALISILNIAHTGSVFVAGGPLYRRYQAYFAARGFRRIVLVCDPYRDLAARLLRLQDLASENVPAGWRGLGQARLIAAFSDVDLTHRPSLERGFDRLETDDVYGLADPMTRKLAAEYSGEPLTRSHVEQALESLAEFDVIGFEDEVATFIRSIEALLGGRVLTGRVEEEIAALEVVKAALESCPAAQELVEFDTEVGSLARRAVEDASGGADRPR